MKISAINSSYCYVAPKGAKSFVHNSSNTGNRGIPVYNVNFAGYYTPKKLIYRLLPITDKIEYDNIIKRLLYSRTAKGHRFWSIDADNRSYKDIKAEYKGLLPYCGSDDVSFYLNGYLGGRLDKCGEFIPTEKTACDFIRVFDYSLKQLDKDFGTYSGYVYRKGYFSTKSGQYASTSESPALAAAFQGFDADAQYSVIKVNDAHKICDFQKSMNSQYADEEREILIDRTMKRRFVPPSEYSDSLYKIKECFARHLVCESKIAAGYDATGENILSFEQAMKKIKVYEQV